MKSLTQFILENTAEPVQREIDTNVKDGVGVTDLINGFVILKPEFLDHTEDFCNMLKNNGWNIIQKQQKKLTKDEAKELYKMHKDKPFYKDLCDYMASDDCLCCSCHKDCKDPIADMKKIKHKVRDAWGKDEMRNGMHSSDSLYNINREANLVFLNCGMRGD